MIETVEGFSFHRLEVGKITVNQKKIDRQRIMNEWEEKALAPLTDDNLEVKIFNT